MFKSYLKRILNLITRPEMKILPGQLAFFLVLAIFPLLTLFGYIGTQMINIIEPVVNALSQIIPENVMQIVLPFIENSHLSGNVLFFMIYSGHREVSRVSDQEVYSYGPPMKPNKTMSFPLHPISK